MQRIFLGSWRHSIRIGLGLLWLHGVLHPELPVSVASLWSILHPVLCSPDHSDRTRLPTFDARRLWMGAEFMPSCICLLGTLTRTQAGDYAAILHASTCVSLVSHPVLSCSARNMKRKRRSAVSAGRQALLQKPSLPARGTSGVLWNFSYKARAQELYSCN